MIPVKESCGGAEIICHLNQVWVWSWYGFGVLKKWSLEGNSGWKGWGSSGVLLLGGGVLAAQIHFVPGKSLTRLGRQAFSEHAGS